MNYLIVLFKNKERKKIINKFVTYERAKQLFDKKVKQSDCVEFEVNLENATPCSYELALIEKKNNKFDSLYVRDSLGRQVKIDLDDENYRVMSIVKFNVEEKLYDVDQKEKITFDKFVKKYLKTGSVKLISKLNNKVVLQDNDVANLFSLKDVNESQRFLDCLRKHLINTDRMDVIVVSDTSNSQKKYLYDILSKMGIDKKLLYRTTTTFKPRK